MPWPQPPSLSLSFSLPVPLSLSLSLFSSAWCSRPRPGRPPRPRHLLLPGHASSLWLLAIGTLPFFCAHVCRQTMLAQWGKYTKHTLVLSCLSVQFHKQALANTYSVHCTQKRIHYFPRPAAPCVQLLLPPPPSICRGEAFFCPFLCVSRALVCPPTNIQACPCASNSLPTG